MERKVYSRHKTDTLDKTQEAREKLFPKFSSDHVLELALGIAKHNRFTADIRRWNEFLWGWKEKMQEKNPLLLKDFEFRRDDNNTHYCPRTAYFFDIRTRSEMLTRKPLDQGALYEISDETKLELREIHSFPFQRYSDTIREFAREIDEHLGINGETNSLS